MIKSEPNALTDDDYSSTASFSDDNEVGYESIELDSDTINEILVNDMECEVVSVGKRDVRSELLIYFIDACLLHFNFRRIINFP